MGRVVKDTGDVIIIILITSACVCVQWLLCLNLINPSLTAGIMFIIWEKKIPAKEEESFSIRHCDIWYCLFEIASFI